MILGCFLLSIGYPSSGNSPSSCTENDVPYSSVKRSAFAILKDEMMKQDAVENEDYEED